jgi:hypothetical protein
MMTREDLESYLIRMELDFEEVDEACGCSSQEKKARPSS